MTNPAKNQHDGIAGKPALKSSECRDWPPYGNKVNPVRFISPVHRILHMSASKHLITDPVNG